MKKSKLSNLKLYFLKKLEHDKKMKQAFEESISEDAMTLNEIELMEGLLK